MTLTKCSMSKGLVMNFGLQIGVLLLFFLLLAALSYIKGKLSN